MSDHRNPRAQRDDAGFSVLEVAVAVLLLGIVSIAMFNFVDTATTTTMRASSHMRAEQEVTIALRTLSQDVRSAKTGKLLPCASGADYRTCLTVEVPRPTGVGAACPSRVVTYQLVSNQVRHSEQVYPANCGAPTTKFTNRVVLDKLVNGATPLFQYFSVSGSVIDPVATPAAVPGAGSVKISVAVDYGVAGTNPIKLSSTVALRNNR